MRKPKVHEHNLEIVRYVASPGEPIYLRCACGEKWAAVRYPDTDPAAVRLAMQKVPTS